MSNRIPLGLISASLILCACHAAEPTRSVTVGGKDSVPRVCSLAFGVSPANATLHIGDTLRFSVSYDPVCMPGAVWRWTSNDTSIALVDSTGGLVRGRAKGTATVVATNQNDRNVKGAATVNVIP